MHYVLVHVCLRLLSVALSGAQSWTPSPDPGGVSHTSASIRGALRVCIVAILKHPSLQPWLCSFFNPEILSCQQSHHLWIAQIKSCFGRHTVEMQIILICINYLGLTEDEKRFEICSDFLLSFQILETHHWVGAWLLGRASSLSAGWPRRPV